MKNKTAIVSYLNSGIFEAVVQFSVGFTYDEILENTHGDWKKAINQNSDRALFTGGGKHFASHRTISGDGKEREYFYITLIDHFDFSDWEMCALAHEIVHVAQWIANAHLDIHREYECFAYLHTHLMKQCLNQLRKAIELNKNEKKNVKTD